MGSVSPSTGDKSDSKSKNRNQRAGGRSTESMVTFFFFKQKTAYEIGTGDWSSDVCSSDLLYEIRFLLGIFLLFMYIYCA